MQYWPSLKRILLPWPFPFGILLVWALAAHFEWMPAQILPSPSTVWATFIDLWKAGDLQHNTLISLERVAGGFIVGAGAGLLLGGVMGFSPLAKDYLYPTFKAYAQIPILGWLPLLIMLLGIDEVLKVVLISKAVLVPITLNTYQGFQNVPKRYVEVAKVYRFTRWQMVKKVVFPSVFPFVWTGVRYGLTHAWLALVAVELLASSEGLGFLIVYGRQLYQMDVVMAAVVAVGAVGFLLDKGLALFEKRFLRWRLEAF